MRPIFADGGDATAGAVFGSLFLLLVLAGIALCLLPIMIALIRRHPNTGPITIIALFLGWTVVGWIVALAWSLSAIDRPRYRGRTAADDNPFA
jgi:hypothetical protein